MTATEGLLRRDGAEIHYWLDGAEDATLIVLTHGATADHTMFDELVPALSPRYRVLTWDVPGHGLSQPLPEDFGIGRLVEDEIALIDHIGARKAILIGQSIGGNLAQEAVFRHPERVLGIVLIDCTDNFQRLTGLERAGLAAAGPLFAMYPYGLLKAQSVRASAVTPAARGKLAAMVDRVAGKDSYVKIMTRISEVLHEEPEYRIPCPLLMFLGEHDKLGNIAKAMPRMAHREGARLVVVPGAGHVANMDRPDIVNSEIIQFLETCAVR